MKLHIQKHIKDHGKLFRLYTKTHFKLELKVAKKLTYVNLEVYLIESWINLKTLLALTT